MLKGHIALANARFPEGTTGTQLDVLAHQYLWQEGRTTTNGTATVSAIFCACTRDRSASALTKCHSAAAGNVISNEPGPYVTNQYGIRIENMVCVKNFKTDFGQFYEAGDIISLSTSMPSTLRC